MSTKVVTIGGKVLKVGGKPVRVLPGNWANRYSLLFDGVDEYCRVANRPMTSATAQSVSLWFRSAPAKAATRRLSIQPNGGGTGYNLILESTRLIVSFTKIGGATVTLTFTAALYDDAWHHVLATVAANGTARLVVDGVLRASAAYASDIPEYTAGTNWDISSTSFRFAGYIDEFALWTAQLSDGSVGVGQVATGQAAELYNAGQPADLLIHSAAGSLFGWWRNGDTDSTPLVITDASGNLRHMNMVNMENEDIVEDTP